MQIYFVYSVASIVGKYQSIPKILSDIIIWIGLDWIGLNLTYFIRSINIYYDKIQIHSNAYQKISSNYKWNLLLPPNDQFN